MDGTLAEYVTLATHATAWLRGGSGAEPELDLGHPVFRSAAAVDFDGVGSVAGWMRALRSRAVDRVWLAVPGLGTEPAGRGEPEAHVAAAFAGGLRAGMLTTGPGGGRYWQAHLTVGARIAADGRIWSVSYLSQPFAAAPQVPGVGSAAATLDGALERAAYFADVQDLATWAQLFQRARRASGGGSGMGARLLPAGWDGAAARLIDTVSAAWVFGGMGSWNDVTPADPAAVAEYGAVTRELYSAVMLAAVAAVNVG